MPEMIVKPARWLPGIRRSHRLARGLLGLWLFSDGHGGTVYDVANPHDIANHGTLTSMDPPTDWVTSPMGDVLDFDGGDDRVDVTSDITSGTITKFSLAALLKIDTIEIAAVAGKDNDVEFAMACHTNGVHRVYIDSGAQRWTSNNGFWVAGEWAHVVWVYNGTLADADKVRVYKDGVLVTPASATTAVASFPATAQSLCFGYDRGLVVDFGYSTLDGQYAQVAFWLGRSLAVDDAAELSADPWGLMRPRTKTYIFLPVGVTGVTRLVGGRGLFSLAGDGGGLAA